ncbi:LapA family protein [Roseicella sp. DB1501]|uniref:LapA family protein n=1 Tax=Roseicella sp. DB1501 TaxID=2730925 RepID=UPI001491CAA4|nr:LapA family protein [Roseicella sp. DB1501]NOG71371.1 LapA family protein [Roseicella sp. DB1501]
MRWILLLPLLILLVLFGLSNREEVALRLWPFDLAWVTPLSVAVLLIGAVCFLFGALVAWMASLPHRRRARRMEDAARAMEAELADFRAAAARQVGPVPPSGGSSLVALQRPAA